MTTRIASILLGVIVSTTTVFAQLATTPAAPGKGPVSFSLQAERFIIDSSHSTIISLSQSLTDPYVPTGAMKLKLAISTREAGAKPIKDLGATDIYSTNLQSNPARISADLSGLPNGDYSITAQVFDGNQMIAEMSRYVLLVAGIDVKQPQIEQRLGKIQGHDGTKATIRYPFDFARMINTGQRGWNAADLGINQAGDPNYYNFADGIKRSEELLAALESGKDPLWQAKGQTERHYVFAETGEILPYRVFVPPTWDGKTPLPMVFILHGNTRNQDFYFERDGQVIPKLAEQHGYMLVGVFGYHPNGGYNVGALRRGAGGGSAPAAAPPQARGGGARGPQFLNGMPTARLGELSEADTMHVFDLIKAEYPIDPKRTFLFGYSAGGNGGYHIAPKYAQNWAAVALGGANTGPTNYAFFDSFKNPPIPFFIFAGENDTGVQPNSRAMVDAMKAQSIDAQFKIYPGATHDTAPSAAIADIYNFFDAHPRK